MPAQNGTEKTLPYLLCHWQHHREGARNLCKDDSLRKLQNGSMCSFWNTDGTHGDVIQCRHTLDGMMESRAVQGAVQV